MKYSLIKEPKNFPLPWCWYCFHEDHRPHLSELAPNMKGVKLGGIYVAGFANEQKAVEYGIKNNWMEI